MSFLPIEIPEFNKRVKAIIKCNISGTGTWDAITAFLVAVDEDDCTWRFHDDNSELAYHCDVVYWEYSELNEE